MFHFIVRCTAVAAASLTFTITGVQAQQSFLEPASPILLEQAITYALKNNSELQVLLREVEASQGIVLQSQARPNPTIAYAIDDTRSATRSNTLQFSLPLELAGKRAARIATAQGNQAVVTADFKIFQAELTATTKSFFFELLAAQERESLAKGSLELAQRATDVAAKRVQAGKVSPVEETRASIAQAGAQIELAQAQSEMKVARQRLSNLWSNNRPQFTFAGGSLETTPRLPTLKELQDRIERAPVLIRGKFEIDRRRAALTLEQAKQTPDVAIGAGVKHANDLGRTQALIGVSMAIPIFDRNEGNVFEARKRVEKGRDELQAVTVRITTDVFQSLEQLTANLNDLNILQKNILPNARKALDVATIGFEFGKFNFLEVLDAQRTLFQATNQYLKALSGAHRSAIEIDRLLADTPVNN